MDELQLKGILVTEATSILNRFNSAGAGWLRFVASRTVCLHQFISNLIHGLWLEMNISVEVISQPFTYHNSVAEADNISSLVKQV
jgi:hypothetical protein